MPIIRSGIIPLIPAVPAVGAATETRFGTLPGATCLDPRRSPVRMSMWAPFVAESVAATCAMAVAMSR